MIHIDILLATYNGKKYLPAQLFSLLQQTHTNWTLWIYDDCSTDDTQKIILDFCRLDSRIRHVENLSTNQGAAKSFFSLLRYANSPYIIFCDQDDIWFEKKLAILLESAEKHLNINRPGLVYCDANLYSDLNGTITANTLPNFKANSLNEFLFLNSGYQGSSTLFNNSLLSYAKRYNGEFYMHDDIIALIAHTFGDVQFIPKSLMLYRQHDQNVTGQFPTNKLNIIKRFLKPNRSVISPSHYHEINAFYKVFKSHMSKSNKKVYQLYIQYPRRSLMYRLLIIYYHNFSLGGYKFPLLIKTLLRKPMK